MDIELRGITKRFGDLVANSNVNLSIRAGEVLGLLGENGAGKSTLMNVLSGFYKPDEGEILIDGKPVHFTGPGDAIRAGIGMVHQHFMLVPVFTVAENVVLGVEPTGALDHLDLKKAREQVRAINDEYGLQVDPDAMIEDLPVGIQQRVEILKVLFRSAQVLVFDEPTAVLTPQEVTGFFKIVAMLKEAGKALVFITHKLHEIHEVADRISVLRTGKIVGEGIPRQTSDKELAEMMVGRPVTFQVDKAAANPGDPLMEVTGLTVLRDDNTVAVNTVSFTVRSGEIVGIAGVQGNGQTELEDALTGLRRAVLGSVRFAGKDVTNAPARDLHKMGLANVPEDRHRSGMIADFSIAENMALNTYYDAPYSRGILMDWKTIRETSARNSAAFDVRTSSIYKPAGQLSGGNQQKMIVAREMSRDTKFLIASQPTRGLDVGSIEYIHKRIVGARDQGDGVIIISSELDEILALSDRILVMFKGRIVAEFGPGGRKATKNDIGLAMAGAAPEAEKEAAA